jgi:peptide/nickel transport system substrate-binding protein
VKLTAFLEADKAPFTNPNLREAVALAIDRDALVSSILSGDATPDGGLLNVLPGQKPAEIVNPDPAKAKSLVTGSPQIELTWPAGLYTNIDDVAQAIGGELTAAGFKVKLNPISYASEVGLILQRQITGIYILAAVPNVAVPDFFAHGFMTSDSITRNCPSSQLDTMANQALETSGPAAAAPIYSEMNTLAVVDQHCYVPLYQETFNYATKGITGLQYNALNNVIYNDVAFTS